MSALTTFSLEPNCISDIRDLSSICSIKSNGLQHCFLASTSFQKGNIFQPLGDGVNHGLWETSVPSPLRVVPNNFTRKDIHFIVHQQRQV